MLLPLVGVVCLVVGALVARHLGSRRLQREVSHLQERRLPAVLANAADPGPQSSRFERTAHGQALRSAITSLTERTAIVNQRERELAEERAALAKTTEDQIRDGVSNVAQSLVRPLAPLTKEAQAAVNAILSRHDDPETVELANTALHSVAQLDRRTTLLRVLCGAPPGRQREAAMLTDVLRGAQSRIQHYERISVPTNSEFAVAANAVEPVALMCAEILDNATRSSRPGSKVDVWFERSINGVSVIIEDRGTGMNPEAARYVNDLLSGAVAVDLLKLGDPAQVGLPGVAQLARSHGFRVSVRQGSAFGGTMVVVFVPDKFLVSPADVASVVAAASSGSGPAASRAETPAPSRKEPAPVAERTTANGLPVRRPRGAAAPGPGSRDSTSMRGELGTTPSTSSEGTAGQLRAFQRARQDPGGQGV